LLHLAPGDRDRKELRLRLWRGSTGGGHSGPIAVLVATAEGPAAAAAGAPDTAKELEQLAYAVSHDLQEPLQLINRNARLLSSRCGEQVDPEARRFLDHLVHSGERLQGMLDGLLSYSRLGFGKGRTEEVDLDALLDRVLVDLGPLLEEAQAEVHRARLPTVAADPNAMRQLFQNLIGNAVKFRGDRFLRLTIGVNEDGDWWRLMVKDNGIGIDPRFQDSIFGMFHRLHTESEYPGTGIGLAICKKIVAQYGGRIWVESRLDQGSAFYFTLPRLDRDEAETGDAEA
jgi:light-regulated signal transduction histidine kinase (bacteriophytochrome)